MKYDVVVIGAGASGMMAAIQAAKSIDSQGKCKKMVKVALLEVLARPGKKLLVTGNGKCNLTNYKLDESCYHTDSGSRQEIMSVIERFDPKAVTEFFREEGMFVRDRDGYVYPYSEQASSVLDCLRQCLIKYGIELICGCEIAGVKKSGNEFTISGMVRDAHAENNKTDAKKNGSKKNITGCKDNGGKNAGKSVSKIEKSISINAGSRLACTCKNLIIATGSAAGGVCNQGMAGAKSVQNDEYNCVLGYNIARQFGHHIIKPLPALVALCCEESFFREISGVRAKGKIKLFVDEKCVAFDEGEIQLTDNGISGIPVFQVSRYAVAALNGGKRKVSAELDFMPEYTKTELTLYIDRLKNDAKKVRTAGKADLRNLSDILTGLVNKKLMNLFIKLSNGETKKLVMLLKHFSVNVVQSKGIMAAQVCSGGVRLDEVNTDTMESKLCEGLYFCGEVLDVDGCCGGYNLQWAWSSGYTAGTDRNI